jgi:hypothetical protein
MTSPATTRADARRATLARAAAQRRDRTLRAATTAIEELDRARQPINFNIVAQRAGVSRAPGSTAKPRSATSSPDSATAAVGHQQRRPRNAPAQPRYASGSPQPPTRSAASARTTLPYANNSPASSANNEHVPRGSHSDRQRHVHDDEPPTAPSLHKIDFR